MRTVAAGLALAAVLGWWAWLHHADHMGYGSYVNRAESLEGQEVVLSLVRVAEYVQPDHMRVDKGALRLDVYGDLPDLEVGTEASIGVRFEDGRMLAQWSEAKSGRRAKKRLGLLALGFLTVFLPLALRMSRDGVAVRG